MKFSKTSLKDAMVIDLVRNEDSRGFFARSFCETEFAEAGLETRYVQQNHSYNRAKGTVRGMHFQRAPHGEVKLVRCLKGGIVDIIIDIRADSPTYLKWEAFELTEENGRTLYVPVGFAHGFQTLVHTAPGAGLFPYVVEESLIGFLEQSSKFLKPVYAGDTIYPALEVIELSPGKTTGVVTLRFLTEHAHDQNEAIAAYYQGLGAVRAHGMYPDTRRYVASVNTHMKRFS